MKRRKFIDRKHIRPSRLRFDKVISNLNKFMHTRGKTSPADSSSKCFFANLSEPPKEKEKGMKNLHSFILALNEKLGNLVNQ